MKPHTRRAGAALLAVLLLFLSTACGPLSGLRRLKVGVYSGSYWGTPSNDCYQILDLAIERFQEQNPGIQVEYVNGIGTDSYSEWLAQQILMGTEPDVYFVLPEDFNLMAASGALEPLDSRMDADPDFDRDAYYPACLRAGQADGRQYALPYESVPTMMFVNKTILEENGISLPGNRWTWDDFYHICSQVTDVEEHRFGVYGYTWLNALYSNGVALFSEDGSACSLSDDRIQESVRFVQRLEELNEGYTVTSRDFDLGHVAFRPFLFSEYRAYQPYPWRVKRYTGFDWECVSMPAGPDGGNASELSTMLLGVSARSRNKDLAWSFLKLLSCDQEIQKELYISSHGISPLPAVAESPEMLRELYESIPGSVDFNPEIMGEIMQTGVTTPRFDGYDQALTMAQSAVAEVLSGNAALQTCLLTAQREINIFLSRA